MHRSVFLSPHSTQTTDIESRRTAEIAATEQRLAALGECVAARELHFIGLCFDDFPRIPKEKLITEVINWRMWMAHYVSRLEARVLSHKTKVSPRTTSDEDAYALFCQSEYPSLAGWLARAGYGRELPMWLIEGKQRRPKPQTVRIVNYEPSPR